MDAYRENDCRGDCLQWGGLYLDWNGETMRIAKNARLFRLAPSVRFFEGRRFTALQYVHRDGSAIAAPVAALIWGKATGEIETVYTRPEFRGQGLARQLLAMARACVAPVRHSPHLTPDGAAWAAKVG